jgi:hypothetical protein
VSLGFCRISSQDLPGFRAAQGEAALSVSILEPIPEAEGTLHNAIEDHFHSLSPSSLDRFVSAHRLWQRGTATTPADSNSSSGLRPNDSAIWEIGSAELDDTEAEY